MSEVTRDGRRIRFAVTAPPDPDAALTPVLLIPGLGGGARVFGTLPRRFARAGHPCITFDPVGTGGSSPHRGPYLLEEAARDVLAVASALDLERCHLVGSSLGGRVGLCAASLAPGLVPGLVLLATAAVASPRGRRVYRFFEVLAQRLEGPELGEILATFLFGTTFHTNHPQAVDDIIRAMRLDRDTRDLMIAQARSLHGFDGTEQARNLACPCLCLAGAEDTLTGPDAIAATAALIPGGIFELVPRAGHTLLLEAPRLLDRITGFLAAADLAAS